MMSGGCGLKLSHGGLQAVCIREGIFHCVGGCGSLEEVTGETQGCTID